MTGRERISRSWGNSGVKKVTRSSIPAALKRYFDCSGVTSTDICGIASTAGFPRGAARRQAHPSEDMAIDPNQAGHRLRRSRPVLGWHIGELVGHRPDAEVRVVGDQWDRRRSMERGLGPPGGGDKDKGCKSFKRPHKPKKTTNSSHDQASGFEPQEHNNCSISLFQETP